MNIFLVIIANYIMYSIYISCFALYMHPEIRFHSRFFPHKLSVRQNLDQPLPTRIIQSALLNGRFGVIENSL